LKNGGYTFWGEADIQAGCALLPNPSTNLVSLKEKNMLNKKLLFTGAIIASASVLLFVYGISFQTKSAKETLTSNIVEQTSDISQNTPGLPEDQVSIDQIQTNDEKSDLAEAP
jgi:hypothetical protein